MTNDQANIMLSSTRIVLRAMLVSLVGTDAAEELLSGAVTTAAPAAGSICAELKDSQDTYDADPTIFVDTPANIDALDDVVDAFVALEKGDIATEAAGAYDALQAASPEV